jgi:uncharacterized membrane protein
MDARRLISFLTGGKLTGTAMETVFQYKIPVLHPLAVHFPVSLLLLAGVPALAWLVRGTVFWRQCTLFVLASGVAGALVAYFTGEAMEEQSEGVPIVDELVGLHEDMALYTVIVACLALAGFAWAALRSRRIPDGQPEPLWMRLTLALAVFAAAVLVAWTAHIGSTMVWGVAR